MNPNKIFTGIIVGIMLLAMSPMALSLFWPKINDVRTGETPEYPESQPQRLAKISVVQVLHASLEVAGPLGWEIREFNREQGLIEAVATVPVFHFRDDVTITATQADQDVVVNIRSRSRIGKSDLGENARRIRKFQAALAEQVKKYQQ